MDYKVQAKNLTLVAQHFEGTGAPEVFVQKIYRAAESITDLLSRAEAAEAELKQRETYYNQMVDALSATDSFEKQKLCEEADHLKDLLKEAEARAEKAERERDAAIARIKEDHWCDDCKFNPVSSACRNDGSCEECETPCYCGECVKGSLWEWNGGQKEE